MPKGHEPKTGYILINRCIRLWRLWPGITGSVYSKSEAWLDLLFDTNWKDSNTAETGEIKRGQALISQRTLAERWRWSRSKVRNFLADLRQNKEITLYILPKKRATQRATLPQNQNQKKGYQKDHLISLVTICNYDRYQFSTNEKEPPQKPSKEPPPPEKRATERAHPIKDIKKRNKEDIPRSGEKWNKPNRKEIQDSWIELVNQEQINKWDRIVLSPAQINLLVGRNGTRPDIRPGFQAYDVLVAAIRVVPGDVNNPFAYLKTIANDERSVEGYMKKARNAEPPDPVKRIGEEIGIVNQDFEKNKGRFR